MMNKLFYFLLSLSFLLMLNQLQAQNNNYVDQWLATNQNRLSEVNFEEFRNIPAEYQRDIFILLPDLAQANIWKQKIDFVLLQNWTQAQRNSLQALYQFTAPEYFSNNKPSNFDADVQTWLSNAKLIFERDVIIDITTLRAGTASTPQFVSCGCTINSWFSCHSCATASEGCRTLGEGCGFLWQSACNGMCASK